MYMWEYVVALDKIAEFERIEGRPAGPLFRRDSLAY